MRFRRFFQVSIHPAENFFSPRVKLSVPTGPREWDSGSVPARFGGPGTHAGEESGEVKSPTPGVNSARVRGGIWSQFDRNANHSSARVRSVPGSAVGAGRPAVVPRVAGR